MESLSSRRRFRRVVAPAIVVALLTLLFPLLSAAQQENKVLVPIGGGYSDTTLQGFAQVVADNATGAAVDILVVPSSYGDDPDDRAGNIELAEERTDQVEAACEIVVEIDCTATLLILFDRADAENPENSNALYDEEIDGVYILGGDQTIAMEVLYETPAEAALTVAYERGVVIGGTSAGAAVQSTNMLAGYTGPGWPYNALERPMIVIWWANDGDDQRGLIFSSDEIIWEQHFYQRGRFTRLLNVTAQSDEQFGGASKLGVGVDVDTAVTLSNETVLSNVFGETSVAIIDGETANGTFEWVGERETLSARNVRSHIMAAGVSFSYDVPTRTPFVNGKVGLELNARDWDSRAVLRTPGRATLMLGGDLSYDWRGPAMADFLGRVEANRPIVIVSADGDVGIGQGLVEDYSAGLREAGWTGNIETLVYGDEAQWRGPVHQRVASAGGVIFVAEDQSRLDAAVNDGRFRGLLVSALSRAPVLLTDSAMTAAMGALYVANPDPVGSNYQDMSSSSFKAGDLDIRRGLGILRGATFQPLLTDWQHWGRIYALTMTSPRTIAFGISEMTAIVVEPRSEAHLVGERSAIALDGRSATYAVGDNGALTAFNVMLDAFAPGDTLVANR